MRLSALGERCNGHSLAVAYALGEREALLLVHDRLDYWLDRLTAEENAGLFSGGL